jgi:type IV pilus assembly protein PilB
MPLSESTLPRIVLRDQKVSLSVLQAVSLAVAEKYQLVAFELTPLALKLAIVHPEQLKPEFTDALQAIGTQLQRSVVLYQTDYESFKAVIGQYKEALGITMPAAPVPQVVTDNPEVPPPPLFVVGQAVALNYLRRVPLAYAKANRVLCIDHVPPSTYWFAIDKPGRASLVEEISKRNKLTAYTIVLRGNEIDDLLAYYTDEENAAKSVEMKQAVQDQIDLAHTNSEGDGGGGEQKIASDVVQPDIQATIISREEEQGGIAGILQRFNSAISAKKVVEDAAKHGVEVEATQPVSVPTPAVVAGISASVPAPVQTSSVQATAATPAPAVRPAATPSRATDGEETSDIGSLLDKAIETSEELTSIIRGGSIPRIVAAVVSFAIHEKASDIHLEVFDDQVRVRLRIDGQLGEVVKLPPDVHAAVVSRIKILAKLRLDETRVPQDGRFDVNFGHAQVDLRVSIMPTVHGEKVVMRILDKTREVSSLDGLGLSGFGYQNLLRAIEKPFGVVLVTGPTGSGKSTSLYAILKQIATPGVNVATLEDPVEYEMKGVNQSQIRPRIGFSFAEGLRAILRQDPNIIMVGEIRDGETANLATQAALTGHLVLSTLHTNDAAGAIPRLTNMGIEPFLITSSVNVVVGQRLVRKVCQDCKSAVNLPPSLHDRFAKELEEIRKINPVDAKRISTEGPIFYQGMGCDKCNGKGYRGRIGIYEVMVMTEEIEDLALKHASRNQIEVQSQKQGMLTMYQDGILKVIDGLTTLDEVLRETSTK